MITIKLSDFEKYGCIQCGCSDVRAHPGIRKGNSGPVQCIECRTQFNVTDKNISPLGAGPPVDHPRKGIDKHSFIKAVKQ